MFITLYICIYPCWHYLLPNGIVPIQRNIQAYAYLYVVYFIYIFANICSDICIYSYNICYFRICYSTEANRDKINIVIEQNICILHSCYAIRIHEVAICSNNINVNSSSISYDNILIRSYLSIHVSCLL